MTKKTWISMIAGLVVFIAMLVIPAPGDMNTKAWHMAAVVTLITIWWITETIELCITALLPIVLLPLFDITPVDEVTLSYAHEAIYLFMGGFMIAIAMERSNLHKRFALYTIRLMGNKPSNIILGFMLATYTLSMWVSNTATVLMIIPICQAITSQIPSDDATGKKYQPFTKALLLSIAYAASIGGVATLIGTPTNIIFASIASTTPGMEISFIKWMLFAFPFSLLFLFLTWLLITKVLFPLNRLEIPLEENYIKNEVKQLGKMTIHEKRILTIFCIVAFLWIFREFIDFPLLQNNMSDATIAIGGAICLFLTPTGLKKGETLLDWKGASTLPWSILLLFGGGLAISKGFIDSGLSEYLVLQLQSLHQLEVWMFIVLATALALFLTEIMSNMAAVTLMLPIMISVANGLGIHPFILTIPITIACSFAFMLPISTPPNAIVYGYGYINIRDMVKTGLWLNILGVIAITLFALYILPIVITL